MSNITAIHIAKEASFAVSEAVELSLGDIDRQTIAMAAFVRENPDAPVEAVYGYCVGQGFVPQSNGPWADVPIRQRFMMTVFRDVLLLADRIFADVQARRLAAAEPQVPQATFVPIEDTILATSLSTTEPVGELLREAGREMRIIPATGELPGATRDRPAPPAPPIADNLMDRTLHIADAPAPAPIPAEPRSPQVPDVPAPGEPSLPSTTETTLDAQARDAGETAGPTEARPGALGEPALPVDAAPVSDDLPPERAGAAGEAAGTADPDRDADGGAPQAAADMTEPAEPRSPQVPDVPAPGETVADTPAEPAAPAEPVETAEDDAPADGAEFDEDDPHDPPADPAPADAAPSARRGRRRS